MNNRSAAIDVLRVIGIVAIVFGHVWDSGSRLLVYPWHVALFFFLTGYFWKFERSLQDEFRKRCQTLIMPPAIWTAIIGLAVLGVMLADRNFDAARTVSDVIVGKAPGRPFMVFWFVLVLFFGAVLLRLMERSKRLPAWAPWVVAGAGIAASYVAGPVLSNTPLYIGLTPPCLLFVVVGVAFRRYRSHFKQWMAWAVLCVSAALVLTRTSAPMDMKPGNFGTPVLSVLVAGGICAAFVILAETYAVLIPTPVGSFATKLSSCALVVILTHASIIFITEGLPQVVVFFLALTLPWIAGLALLRTPASIFLTGARHQVREWVPIPA